MKTVLRWVLRLLLALVVLGTAFVLLKDALLKELIESRLRDATGLGAQIGKFEMSLLSPAVSLRDLRLYNTPQFGGSVFLELPELRLEYDREALSEGRLRLRLLRLSVSELNIVQDGAGRSNVEVLQARMRQHQPPPAQVRLGGVETFNLSLGRVRWYQVQHPEQARVLNLDVQNEVFTNLETETDFALAIGRLAIKLGVRELSKLWKPPTRTPPPARPKPARGGVGAPSARIGP